MLPGRVAPLPRVRTRAVCGCDCGQVAVVQAAALVHGATRSCGCLAKETTRARVTTHGGAGPVTAPEYNIWRSMKARCTNPAIPNFKHYGGRGITVCAQWRDSFEAFLADVGPRPSMQHTLDRIDNNGPYTGPCTAYPTGNVRWATGTVQHSNTRTNHVLTFNGLTQTVTHWAHALQMPVDRLYGRLRKGWSVERALTTPPRHVR